MRFTHCFDCNKWVSSKGLNCAVCKAPYHYSARDLWRGHHFYGQSDDGLKTANWNDRFAEILEEHFEDAKRRADLMPKPKRDLFDYLNIFTFLFLFVMISWATALWIMGSI